MSKRLKESGHSFRIKKAKREQENVALSGSLNRFLNINSNPSSSTTENESELIESNIPESSISGNETESYIPESSNSGNEKQSGEENISEKKYKRYTL